MINTINFLKTSFQSLLSDVRKDMIENSEALNLYEDDKFAFRIKELTSSFGAVDMLANTEMDLLTAYYFKFVEFRNYMQFPYRANPVQEAVRDLLRHKLKVMRLSEKEKWDECIYDGIIVMTDIVEKMIDAIKDEIEDYRFRKSLETICGDGIVEYILGALQYYLEHLELTVEPLQTDEM